MRKGVRAALIAAVAVTLLAGAALIGVGIWGGGGEAPTAAATSARRSVESVGGQLDAPAASTPHAVRIPAIDFAADIKPYAVEDRTTLYPPSAEEVFWLSDYGLVGEGAENTAYLIGHTSADGRAVFDPLVDRAAGTSTVLPGDELLVDTETGTAVYEVIAVELHARTALAEVADVWTRAPGRLVLVTCFFDEQGRVSDNLVMFARLTGGA